jgi:Gig2-like
MEISPMRKRVEKGEGDISDVFASLAGDAMVPLPQRYGELKREIIGGNGDAILASWKRLLPIVEQRAHEAKEVGSSIFPQIEFSDMKNSGVDPALIDMIKRTGVCIVRNAIPSDESEELLANLREYIESNPTSKGASQHSNLISGFPSDDPQIWELYWSPSQVLARSHPNTIIVTTWLSNLFHSDDPDLISLDHQLSYADRIRIRHPGDAKFALGPHIDGGGIERWEDPTYRKVYNEILTGNWENLDSFNATFRADAMMELYSTVGGASVFRTWQGWLSLSETGPGEGTLKVCPFLKEATAYWMLRPLVRQTDSGDWEIDISGTEFHGAVPGRGQELSPRSHPHLSLPESMPSLPTMHPGDFVFWQCDSIHAVESIHQGEKDAVVLYIPAVPLCIMNVDYIKEQKKTFLAGTPPPDFPGAVGERTHVGRAGVEDLEGYLGRKALGFERFHGEGEVVHQANLMLDL